jgi:hypothetical protein
MAVGNCVRFDGTRQVRKRAQCVAPYCDIWAPSNKIQLKPGMSFVLLLQIAV